MGLLLVSMTPTAANAATSTPSSAVFGQVEVGSSSTITVRLAFTAEAETLDAVTVTGDGAFTLGALNPGECQFVDGCHIPITFSPTTTGDVRGQVEVNSHGLINGDHILNIPLTGTGTAPVPPASSVGSVLAAGKSASLQGFALGVKSDGNTVTGVLSWTTNGRPIVIRADCLSISGSTAIVAGRMPAGNSTVPHTAVFAVTDHGRGNDLISYQDVIGAKAGACPQITASERVVGEAVVKSP